MTTKIFAARLETQLGDDVAQLLHAPIGDREPRPAPSRQRLAGRFDLLRVLGEGPLGAIFVARDHVLGRSVAIRTLRTSHLEVAEHLPWLKTFRHEASQVARLQHPNITTLHDFGVEGGVPFMIYELLRGVPLRARIDADGLGRVRAVHFAKQLVSALMHAHGVGVVHGHLTLDKVSVEAGERLKIMGFGEAALRARCDVVDGSTASSDHTPERHSDHSWDVHTDVWAVGRIVYDLLFRDAPRDVHQETTQSTLDKLLADLHSVLVRCLQPDTSKRPEGLGEVLAALERLSSRVRLEDVSLITPSRRSRLVPRPDAMVGRGEELGRVRAWLNEGARVVSMVGPGGCGKTRLAWASCVACQEDFEEAHFCDLTEARTTEGVLAVVAQALDVALKRQDSMVQVAEVMAGRGRVLLVLDNVEQVVTEVSSILEQWLERMPNVVFLVTSRQRLAVVHDSVLMLEPFDVPAEASSWPEVADNDAVRLFVVRAQARVQNYVLNASNASDVVHLVRALGGLPLAIELAAARVRVLTPGQMLKKMHRPFDVLHSHRRDMDPRQHTLRAAIAWSWDLLEPWAQATLAQLSVFEGGFTLEAAERVVDLTPWPDAPFIIDVLEALLDRSLLRQWYPDIGGRRARTSRFMMWVSVDAFAKEQYQQANQWLGLEPCQVVKNVEQRHGDYFSWWGSADGERSLKDHRSVDMLRQLSMERDNLMCAGRRAVARGDMACVIGVASALTHVLLIRGPLAAGIRLLTGWLDALPLDIQGLLRGWRGMLVWRGGDLEEGLEDLRVASQYPSTLRVPGRTFPWLTEIGLVHMRQGQSERAREHLLEALAVARREGHVRDEASVLGNLAILNWLQGRLSDARRVFVESIQGAKRCGDRRLELTCRGNLAIIDKEQGRLVEAREGYLGAMTLARDVGDRVAAYTNLGNLALIDVEQGRLDDATEKYTHVLSEARALGDRLNETVAFGSLALIQFERGDFVRAREGCEQTIAMARALGEVRLESIWLGDFAVLEREQGYLDDARRDILQALSLARSMSDRGREGEHHGALASIEFCLGQFEAARTHYGVALEVAREVDESRLEAQWLQGMAAIDRDEQRFDEARGLLQQALEISRRLGDRRGEGDVLIGLGELALAQRQYYSARQHLAAAEAVLRDVHARFGVAYLTALRGVLAYAMDDPEGARGCLVFAQQAINDMQMTQDAALAKHVAHLERLLGTA